MFYQGQDGIYNLARGTNGEDTLIGGANGAENWLFGDTGGHFHQLVGGVAGNDTLVGGAYSRNFLFGDTSLYRGATGGSDTLTGGENSTNTLAGDSDMFYGSRGGNDSLTGGRNSTNTLYGDGSTLADGSMGGDDTLRGGIGGSNYMFGDAEYVSYYGFYGYSNLSTGGVDRLIDAAGTTDHMWGDFRTIEADAVAVGGNDTFVFGANNGSDIIYDLQQGKDLIDLSALTGVGVRGRPIVTSFARLNIDTSADVNGDGILDSVIHLGAGNSVTVLGITNLKASDFDLIV